ncbi:hypothetical protein CAPTEDRAFT_109753, partial [Capitella teleta]
VKEGKTAEFTCQVKGEPTPDLTWFIDDKEVKPEGRYTITEKNQLIVFQVKDVTPEDVGKYTVIAKNPLGEATCSANLEVDGRAPTFVEKPMKCTVLEGGTAMFRCRVDGNPEPKVEWSKGKWRKMENNAKTRVFFDEETKQYVLEMDDIKTKDAGTYTVTISNEYGSDTCSVTLICTDKEEDVQDWKAALKKTSVQLPVFLTFI